jgi:hypothetical protein
MDIGIIRPSAVAELIGRQQSATPIVAGKAILIRYRLDLIMALI